MAEVGKKIVLQDYPLGFRHKFQLKMTSQSDESTNVFFEMTEPFEETKKVLFYALGEKTEYFDFSVKLVSDSGEKKNFEVKQTFENGYGAILDVEKDLFEGEGNPRIRVIAKASSDEYIERKVELGFEIIDSIDNKKDIREIEIIEHVYGSALKETCYKVKDIQNSTAMMLINTFTQSVMFNIRNEKDAIVYSLDVFNNYFIKLPQEFYDPDYYFCFKHINLKTEEEEKYGNVFYDFQIYYEDELSNYTMFIMPLINGKIYTHVLKSGDIMVYRNSFYDGLSEKKIYSANMLRISGSPLLYGFTCDNYPNCDVEPKNLKDSSDKVFSLNMYHINKRLNAEGNTEIDAKGEAVYELRKQYMTIVSCESDEKYPNKGECKYTIEINNEGNTIQLIPETVFSTSIISPKNYFLIRLNNYKTLKYLKLHFTVLTGNAELSIYTDPKYETKLTDYNFDHIHRKEIIEINKDLKENYYILITCQEGSFIQLKYETNEHYKGYNNLMPNEVNLEPIDKNSRAYYNMFNPHYFYPFDSKSRNNDFYYKIIPIDCTMDCSDVSHYYSNIKVFDFLSKRNILYQYLSTYGFIGQAKKFAHTSSKDEKCGIIIYNGEAEPDNRPLLVSSDLPLNSTFDNIYYEYPIIFDEKNDNGIIIEFKLYNNEELTEKDLYSFEIIINGNTYHTDTQTIGEDKAIYIPKSAYEKSFKENIMGYLDLSLKKKYKEKKYYITTNFIGAKISPEYIYSNKDYKFNMRPKSLKYFYSQISKSSEGNITFNNLPKDIELYAKIVEKNKIEDQHDWNGRVKLPTANDPDLIEVKEGIIEYNKNMTEICDEGCEIYLGVDTSKIQTDEDLITLTFNFIHKENDYIDTLDYDEIFEAKKDEMKYYKIKYTETNKEGDIVVITTTPKGYTQPGYIYISNEEYPSIDNYNYISQTIGTNLR